MKVKLLDQHHPEHDAEELSRFRALYDGGRAWHAHLGHWLPTQPDELPEQYQERLKRAVYTNNVAPIVEMFAGHLFAEAPQIEGIDEAWWETWSANVDREGRPLGRWCKERFTEALIGRRSWCWVNLPARDPEIVAETLGDEEQLGLLDPFLVPLTPEQVIDWEFDAAGKLLWVMIRGTLQRRPSFAEPRQTVHRWTYIDAVMIRRWEWTPKKEGEEPDKEAEADVVLEVAHGFGEIPVACLELPLGMWLLHRIHDVVVAHVRARNDLSWALHRAAHALLWLKRKWQDDKPVLGPGRYLQLSPDDDVGYAEPSGANFELLRQDLADLREELYRVVHQMALGADSTASRATMSGDSKATDWRATEVILAAYAEVVRPFIAEVARLAAKARGLQVQPTVKGLDGWQEEDLLGWLDAAALATDAMAMSPTFRKAVAKRQAERVLQGTDNETLAKVRDEIDKAPDDGALWAHPPEPGEIEPGLEGGEGAAVDGATKLQDLALNGAQIKSALDIVGQVARGELPRESGIAMLEEFFAQIDREAAERIMGTVGKSFKVEPPEPLPAAPGFGGPPAA